MCIYIPTNLCVLSLTVETVAELLSMIVLTACQAVNRSCYVCVLVLSVSVCGAGLFAWFFLLCYGVLLVRIASRQPRYLSLGTQAHLGSQTQMTPEGRNYPLKRSP